MRVHWLYVFRAAGLAACICCAAAGQQPTEETAAPSPDGGATPAGETAPAPAPPATATAPAPEGDIIVLKNGKRLVGFQITRQTTRDVVVRLLDGVEMTIPMRQVESIQLDDISGSQPGGVQDTSQPGHELIPGVKLAPVMYEKLQRSVSETPLSFKNEDAIANVVHLSQQVEVPLDVDTAVEQLGLAARKWTVEIPAGTKFLAVLNDFLLQQFPDLDVTYKYDRLILTTKAAAAAKPADAESSPTPETAAPASPPAAEATPATP